MNQRPWINIEDEHGDPVLMRWPDPELGKASRSARAARNFFWFSVGLSVVFLAIVGLCAAGLVCFRLIKATIIGGLLK